MEILHNDADISESERTSIATKIAKASNEIDRITLADKRIIARLSGDESIVMNKQDIDSFYKRKLKDDIDSLSPLAATVAKANLIGQTRTVPTEVKNEIVNNILSGDPELIGQSADLIDRIDQIPGMSELAVNANQRAFVDNVVTLSANLEPEQAVQIARELTDPRDKARVEERTQRIKDERMQEDYAGDVESEFDVFFGGELQDNVNLQQVTSEYKDLFESFFKAGIDKEAAEAKAIDILKTNWKDSQFGFMKNPPESYYNVAGQTEYIKDQLLSDLKAGTIGTEFSKDNIFLLSDEITDRQASQGNPSYRMMVQGEDGLLSFPVLTDENGNPTNRWVPDRQAEAEKQKKASLEIVKEKRSGKELAEARVSVGV